MDYDKILDDTIINLFRLEKLKQQLIKNNKLEDMENVNDKIEIVEERLFKLLGY